MSLKEINKRLDLFYFLFYFCFVNVLFFFLCKQWNFFYFGILHLLLVAVIITEILSCISLKLSVHSPNATKDDKKVNKRHHFEYLKKKKQKQKKFTQFLLIHKSFTFVSSFSALLPLYLYWVRHLTFFNA